MSLTIVGFCGVAQAGKTTAASFLGDWLRKHHGASVVYECPVAGPVKAFARQLGWDGVKSPKGRRLLQLLGTECGRECIHPDVWVRKWEELLPTSGYVLVDDVRFANERHAIVSRGGVVVRIVRPDHDPSDHASERDDVEWDKCIDNDGSLDDMRNHVERFAAARRW